MESKKLKLSYTNNLADRPNNFIRMCCKICNQYKLTISSMKAFNRADRSFEVEMVGSDSYVHIFFNYEESDLQFSIIGNDIMKKSLENYIVNGASKINYKKGEIVFDEHGDEYKVIENTNIPLSQDGTRRSYKVKVENSAGEMLEISDLTLSCI